ncbi:MAG TPA: winged helix DNA-binding domain-containing protein [Ktedonobacteraceae bacterium]|nr:winged helix DNA-binding domain-containing protein [Ktedonobacteraceae bacterium]
MDIASQRLFNQHIAGEKFQQPEEVVRWLGALQAQDYLQALWAIGLRMQSTTIGVIEQAITDRKILRTWPMRGTLHFVPSEDAKWMLKLSPARLLAGDRRRQKQLEIDEAVLQRTQQLFHDALAGDKRCTRSHMMKLLEEAGIATKGQRGYHLLWYMAQAGLICLGPMENKEQTFVLLDEWVPHARELSREEGLAALAERYFTSHGPATLQDFAGWAGVTLTEARTGLEAAKAALQMERGNGQVYWMSPDAPGQKAGKLPSVHLLPGFDEYLLGYKDRSAVLAVEHAAQVVPGNNGVFFPIVVAGGRVIGTWKRTLGKNALAIVLKPFTSFGDAEEQIIEATRAYSDFLGLPCSSIAIRGSNED